MINKAEIISNLIGNLKKELNEIEAAARSSRDLANQDDLKSEGKYDTRAIEATYLAGAQEKRVEELKLDIQMLDEIELVPATRLQLGALAKIEFNSTVRYYFLTSTAGGSMLNIDGEAVLVISVFSPLGNAALGLVPGESFEVETPKETRTYTVLEVF